MSRGSIRPRGPGKWQVSAYVDYDRATGNQKRVYRTVVGTKRQAGQALTALLAEVDAGSHRIAPGSFADLYERHVQAHEHDWAPGTVVYARMSARAWVMPTLGHLNAARVTPADLDALYAKLRRDGLAPGTVRRVHSVIRTAFADGVRWRELTVNPAQMASPPKLVKTDLHPPSPEQIATLLEYAEPRFRTLLTLAATTGARRGELCALRWRHVDLEAGELLIERNIGVAAGGRPVEKSTKSGKARRIALSPGVVAVLRSHLSHQRQNALALGGKIGPDSFLFSPDHGRGGTPLRPDGISAQFRRLTARAGLPPFRLHDIRHAVATQLLARGVDVRTVAGRLGHANPAVTLQVYAHFVPSADRAAADLADEWLTQRSRDVR